MIDNLVLSRAKAAVLARDFSTATRLFQNLLRDNPDDVQLLTQVGNMYVKAGYDDKALPIFKKILTFDAENLSAMNNLGAIYRRKKNYSESEEILIRARNVHGGNSQVDYNLGFTYKNMGEYEKAIQCFENVIAENSADVLAYNHIGAIYAERGDHENAVHAYLRALKIDPNHPILHLNIAKSYENLGKTDEALVEYENALRTKPGWLEAIDGYADLLMKNRRSKDAGAVVMQAIRLSPENEKMHTKLGTIFEQQGDAKSAVSAYSTALNIKDDYVPALSGLASSYEKTGNLPAALQTMEKLESIKPNDSAVLQQYSGILLSAKQVDEAKQKIDTLLKIADDDPHTLNLLGQYDICIGDFDSAKKCFDKIEQLAPSYKEYLKDGAKRMRQQGIFYEAEVLEKEYLAEHPEDPEALTFLAELYEEQNRVSDALEMYKRTLDADDGNVLSESGIQRLQSKMQAEDAPIFDSIEDVNASQNEIKAESEPLTAESESELLPSEIETSADADFQNQEKAEDDTALEVEDEEPSLSALSEESSVDIFADMPTDSVDENSAENAENPAEIVESAKNEDMDFFVSPVSAETPTEVADIQEMQDSVEEKVEKSIDEIVPLDDVTDFDFSEIQQHTPSEEENFSWPLVSDPVKDFTPPNVLPMINSASLQEALKNAIPKTAAGTIAVVHINVPPAASAVPKDIDSAWDEPETSAGEDDFASSDLNNAVDFTEDFESQNQKAEEPKSADFDSAEKIAGLFEEMKQLGGSLPAEKKQAFFESRQRMLLEYVLSRLQHKAGLLCVASQKREQLGLSEVQSEGGEIRADEVRDVMNCLIALSENLADKALSVALKNETQKVLTKL